MASERQKDHRGPRNDPNDQRRPTDHHNKVMGVYEKSACSACSAWKKGVPLFKQGVSALKKGVPAQNKKRMPPGIYASVYQASSVSTSSIRKKIDKKLCTVSTHI